MNTTSADPQDTANAVVAAGILFVDDAGALLMVRPSYKPYWDIPGGYVRPGETPRAACRREVKEELGLDIYVGDLLSVDWAPHPDEGDKILFIFDGGQPTDLQLAEIHFGDGEIAEYAFVPADELAGFTIPRLVRRLGSTLAARHTNRTVYLEDGSVGRSSSGAVAG